MAATRSADRCFQGHPCACKTNQAGLRESSCASAATGKQDRAEGFYRPLSCGMALPFALEFNTPSVAAAKAVAGKGISRNMQ